MAYCVNCGVKLKSSEKKCPLCNTPVYNPNNIKSIYEPVYPNNTEQFKKINYKFIAKLLICILLVISLIIIFCDFITSGNISWSIYAVVSILCLSSFLQYFLQKNIYVSHVIQLIGIELLIFFIALLNNGLNWFFYLVLPFIFLVWIYIVLCTFFIRRKKKNVLRRISVCLLFGAIDLLSIEAFMDLYKYKSITFNWALYAATPIIILGLIIFILSFNKKIIDEIRQRMFI